MRPRKKKPPKIPPSDDDLWLDELHTECARAIARWLKAGVNLERQIKTLTLPELKGVAAAVEAHWLQMVSKRIVTGAPPMTDEEKAAYTSLLYG